MVALLRFAYVMALRRVVTGWRMEAVLFGSILLAVALMASGVVFSELLSNAALRAALVDAEPEDVNLRVRTFSSREDPQDVAGRREAFAAREEFVQEQVAGPFRPYLREYSRFVETATFFFQGHPQLELDKDHRPRGAIVSLTGLADRVHLVEGRLPGGAKGDGEPLDVAVDRQGAEFLQLGLGDVMEVFPATSFAEHRPMEVRISAIFEVVEPSDEFWYGLSYAFSRRDDRWTLVPLFTAEELLIDEVLGAFPSLYTDTTWHLFTDREGMRAAEVGEVQDILVRTERRISSDLRNSSYSIRLDSLLNSYEEQLLLGRLPLFLVLFLVTGILVYYLALIAGLIVRSRASEIAMLKSRGATTWQLGLLGLGEGLFLAVPAVVAGPFLSLGMVKLLGFLFFGLGGSDGALSGVHVGISPGAFYLGLAGGALAVVVFTLATLFSSRRSSVESRQSGARPPTTSFLHRYYLDIALLALIGVLWWQLQNQGTFLVQSLGTRELSINYTLLLGPVLGLLAAGLIVLRLFPIAAAAIAALAGPVGPAWLVHVVRHISRDPMTPGDADCPRDAGNGIGSNRQFLFVNPREGAEGAGVVQRRGGFAGVAREREERRESGRYTGICQGCRRGEPGIESLSLSGLSDDDGLQHVQHGSGGGFRLDLGSRVVQGGLRRRAVLGGTGVGVVGGRRGAWRRYSLAGRSGGPVVVGKARQFGPGGWRLGAVAGFRGQDRG